MQTDRTTIRRHLLTAVAFGCFLFAIHSAAKWLYMNKIESHSYLKSWTAAAATPRPDIDVVIIGNSHPALAINAALLGRAENDADLDEMYMVNYFRLRSVLDSMDHAPKAVVMPLSLHGFRPILPKDYEHPYRAQVIDFVDLARRTGDYRHVFYGWFRAKAMPYAGSSQEILRYFEDRGTTEIFSADRLMNADWTTSPDRAGRTAEFAHNHFEGASFFNPITAHYFTAILDLCAQRNVTVVLIQFPVSKIYLDYVSENILDVPKWRQFTDGLLAGRSGIVRLDYQQALGDELFGDPLHPNADGARKITLMLKDELVGRGLLSAAPS